MLQGGTDTALIAAYLDKVATEKIGLDTNSEHSRRVVELLLDRKTEVQRVRRQQT